MPTLSVSDKLLPTAIGPLANRLLSAGYDKENVSYDLTDSQMEAAALTPSDLARLLTTPLTHKPGKRGIVHSHGHDRSGNHTFKLNYDLTP